MKNTLIRLIAIMTLASSMSAFAATEKAKSSAAENTSTAPSEDMTGSCTSEEQAAWVKEQQTEQNKKDRERQRLLMEQEKQWEHDLHNITAG